jgi:hypothetical protein
VTGRSISITFRKYAFPLAAAPGAAIHCGNGPAADPSCADKLCAKTSGADTVSITNRHQLLEICMSEEIL